MAPRHGDLERLQGWMQAVVTHRGGVAVGIASPAAQEQVEVGPGDVEALVTPSATLSADERLAIYQRSYFGRLLEVLRATFPALRRALGDRLFDDFALDYLDAHPSESYTLDRLPQSLPTYLETTRPDHDAPTEGREGWIDFVIELATVERDFLEVWDGPGVEGRPQPNGRDLAALAPAACGGLRLRPTPCLRLYELHYPVHDYLAAVRRGGEPALPAPRSTTVALTRRDYRLHFVALTSPQLALLRTLDGERTFDEALVTVGHQLGCRPRDLLRPAQDWLVRWAGQALFEIGGEPDRA